MRLPIALSVLICCAACRDSPVQAVQRAAEARAAAEARQLPELPVECRRERTGGLTAGQRLDMATMYLAGDRAPLNAQILGCAGWYDQLRDGLSGPL